MSNLVKKIAMLVLLLIGAYMLVIILGEEESQLSLSKKEQKMDSGIQVVMVEDQDEKELISSVFNVSGDLSYETQICVAYALLNRVGSENYPDSLAEVVDEFNHENLREAEFITIDDPIQQAEILEEARKATEEAVHTALVSKSTAIRLPADVTIISVYDLDRFEEWTSDCVDGLRFYYE